MIPLIANIRKAIYCLNKRIDQLDKDKFVRCKLSMKSNKQRESVKR